MRDETNVERNGKQMLAISVLDPTVRMLFFGAAVVLLVLASIGFERGKLSFMALGLALFVFPFFWDALAVT